ncbi:MAG TPA: heparin lyase I family protein [Pilimelia sp.]|nr:heparin lyase I family protein [Pilimelia sp.]
MATTQGRWGRALLTGAVVSLLLAAAALAQPAAAAAARPQPVGQPHQASEGRPGWKLRWAPQGNWDGMRAFEHVEEDRAGSHPDGQPHIHVQGNSYRFNMHMVDRDTSTDRQRHEVRGMRTHGRTINLLKGETWRFTYSMFIPDTLKATTTFSHIMQTKAPGTGTNPMIVTSLRRHGTVPKIELKVTEGNVLVGAVDLLPLQNRWIDIEFEMKIGDAPDGWVRWVVRDGSTTIIDTTTTGVDNWLFDRVRMKWGIYRSLGDASGSLQDTHLLIRDLRAYQWSHSFLPPPSWRYEAERAVIHQGSVENGHGGFSGTGFVNYDDAAGGYVEWTVYALCPGPAALNLWYANATTISRPMDITVNGVLVADDLDFGRTPAWNDWETRTLITALRAGANTIRATAATADGGPNVDSLEVQTAG